MRRGIEERNRRSERMPSGAVRKVVGHQHRLAVGRDGRGDRLPATANPSPFAARPRSITETSLLKRLQTYKPLPVRADAGAMAVCPAGIVARVRPESGSITATAFGAAQVTISFVPAAPPIPPGRSARPAR